MSVTDITRQVNQEVLPMAEHVTSREAPNVPVRGGRPPAAAPSRYKVALLTWAAAYATITLILALLGPAMAPWPLPLRTLVLSVLMVAALTWVVMPLLTRLFRHWLTSRHETSR
jgi:antibiotic biosynthesis monooxygenase (ABM) superfamily enzyme